MKSVNFSTAVFQESFKHFLMDYDKLGNSLRAINS